MRCLRLVAAHPGVRQFSKRAKPVYSQTLLLPKRGPWIPRQIVVHLRTSFQHPPLRFPQDTLRKDLIGPLLTSRRPPDNGRILLVDILAIHSDAPSLQRLRIVVAAIFDAGSIKTGPRAHGRMDVFVCVFEGFGASFSGEAIDAEVVPRGAGCAAGNGVDGGYGVINLTYEST